MDAVVDQHSTTMRHGRRQRIETKLLDLVVPQICEPQRGIARDEETKGTVAAEGVASTLVIDSAAIEGIDHPPGTRKELAPERSFEQQGGTHIMPGSIKMSRMTADGKLQFLRAPVDKRQSSQRHCHNHEVSDVVFLGTARACFDPIGAVRQRFNGTYRRVEIHLGIKLVRQSA